jgi:hypothetical protein
MSDDNYDVVLTMYGTIDQAKKDFDALVKLVEDKKVTTAQVRTPRRARRHGEVHVTDATDHLARKGLIGKFIEHRIDSKMEAELGEKLPKGSAGVIAMVEAADSAATNAALAGSMAIAVSPVEAKGVKGLQEGLKAAAKPGSMHPPTASG